MNIHNSNQEMLMSQVYQVEIMQHQDWHYAVCGGLPGLFVGSCDKQVVEKNIPESIEMLILHDEGRHVTVKETPPTSPTILGHKTYIVTTSAKAA